MRKVLVALALIAGVILAGAGAASAAPPVRESGIHTDLSLFDVSAAENNHKVSSSCR